MLQVSCLPSHESQHSFGGDSREYRRIEGKPIKTKTQEYPAKDRRFPPSCQTVIPQMLLLAIPDKSFTGETISDTFTNTIFRLQHTNSLIISS